MPPKNKGGRPRKNVSAGGAIKSTVYWKKIENPKSRHHYEVSSQGEVRRKKKDGTYYNLKPWITGGPYSAVYLTGIEGATRNRKKIYVHRLVASHFVQGKASNKVVHHTVGPSVNTKSSLKWVTPSENNKARRFFTDDGKRRTKKVYKKKKVEKNVPAPKKVKQNVSEPPEKEKKKEPAAQKSKAGLSLPSDPDEYYNAPSFLAKLTYLVKKWKPFRKAWMEFRKKVPEVNQKNLPEKFKQATGKKLKMGDHPASWNTRLISAMYEIERRLERDS